MKMQLVVSAFALGIATTASAVTLNFTNGSGTYSSGGITATISAHGGPLYYNGLEPSGGSVGVGYTALDGAIGIAGVQESLTVTFNQSVHLNSVSFTQWEGGIDQANVSYTGGSRLLSNSLFDLGLVDTLSTGGVTLSSFTVTPANLVSIFYLHGVDVTAAVPVPAAAWLMGSGLVGLAGLSRRKKTA